MEYRLLRGHPLRARADPQGLAIHVYVKERPTISEIEYLGLSSVSKSDVLDRFKERKVGLSPESQYDPTKVKKAEVTIKELLSEHGRQFATVRTEVRPIPPAKVGVTFVVKEGPKVKVGKITLIGNKHVNSRILRGAMKNLKPIGIPHSIFLENIFAKTYDATKLDEDTERVRDEFQNRGYFKVLVAGSQDRNPRHRPSRFHVPLLMTGPGQGGRYHYADRGRRPVPAGRNHVHRTTKQSATSTPCARSSP